MAYPSTFVDLQNAVLAKARMSSSTTSDVSKAKDWINQVYSEICVETEANQTSATMSMTANSYSYTLPAAVARIKAMFVTPSGGVQQLPLQKISLDKILRLRISSGGAATASGSSQYYAVLGLTEFEVYPTPTAADVITVYYVAQPTALSGDTDVSILPEPYSSKLLEYGALAEAADFKGDPSESEYRQMYQTWRIKFIEHLNRAKGGMVEGLEFIPDIGYPPHDPSTDAPWWNQVG